MPNTTITPGAGSASITALTPNVFGGFAPLMAAGALAVSGVGPSMSLTIAPPAASLSVAGTTPGLYYNVRGATSFTPGAGSVQMTTQRSYTVTPGVGALAVTGYVQGAAGNITPPAGKLVMTTTNIPVAISPSVGALTFAGSAPVNPAIHSVTPGAGALGFTGLAAPLNYTIAPPAGSLSELGSQPTQKLILPAPPAGSIAFVGVAPVIQGQNTPSAAALTLNGLAPSVFVSAIITPAAATLSLAGNAPAVTSRGIAPSTGVLSIAGGAPRLDLGITPGAGALQISATLVPFVNVGGYGLPGAGSLVSSGSAPGIGLGMPIPAGALSLVGYAPNVAALNQVIVPSAGALSMSGSAPIAVASRLITPSAGALLFAGLVPINQSAFISVPAGAVTFNGLPATVSSAVAVTPSVGALSLAGAAPSVQASHIIIPGVGSETYSGASPVLTGSVTITPTAGVIGIFGQLPEFAALINITPYPGALTFQGAPPVQAAVGIYEFDPYYYVPGRSTGTTQQLPPLGAGESVIVTFNFADELEPGETLLGPIGLQVQTTTGIDPYPMDVLDGPPAFDPTITQIMVPVTNGVQGCYYYLIVQAQTSNPYKRLARYAILPVLWPAGQITSSVNTTIAPSAGVIAVAGLAPTRTP